MALSAQLVTNLLSAVCSQDLGNELAKAVGNGDAVAQVTGWTCPKLIVATNVSQTIDFGSLLVGDKVLILPATAGNAQFVTIATAGTLGQAAVVGSLYVVLRAFSLPTYTSDIF